MIKIIIILYIVIVDTIGSIDDLIEKYEEIVNKLNKLSNELYLKSIANASDLTTLKDYISIETGSMNLEDNNPDGKYDFYTRNEGVFKCDNYTHNTTGVIVAGEGNFKPKYASGKFGLHQRAYLIKSLDTSIINNETLFELINSNQNFLNGVAVGSTVKSLRRNSFENMPFYKDGLYSLINDKTKIIRTKINEYGSKIEILNNAKKLYLDKYFK